MQAKHLTADIGFDETQETLDKVIETLKPYYGKKVILWGGGGFQGDYVTLKSASIEPTIMRDHNGYTLKVSLSDCPKSISYHDKPGIFEPWIGSWQLSV